MHEATSGWPSGILPDERDLERNWGRSCLHVRDHIKSSGGIITIDDVHALLCDGRARFPHFILLQDGKPLDPRKYTVSRNLRGTPGSGFIDLEAARDVLADGGSLQLNNLHEYWPPVAALCEVLQERSLIETSAIGFLSPPGKGAFVLHQDLAHVLVLQTEGEKHWEVFAPFGGEAGSGPVERPANTEPAHRMTFQKNDVFYMPPLWPHRARSGQSWSLHVTLYSRPISVASVLRSRIEELLSTWESVEVFPEGGWGHGDGNALDVAAAEISDRLRESSWKAIEPVGDTSSTRATKNNIAEILGMDPENVRRP